MCFLEISCNNIPLDERNIKNAIHNPLFPISLKTRKYKGKNNKTTDIIMELRIATDEVVPT